MNETLKILEERRSSRKFKPEMIKEEDIQAVLRAGTFAPSAMGRQSAKIIAVTNKTVRDEIARENCKIGGWKEGFDPFYGAPVILIVIADKNATNEVNAYFDGALVMGNMLNAAASLGLGSIWINRAKEEFSSNFGKNILQKLGIEGEYVGIAHCALGYVDGELPKAHPRKADYVHYIE